MSDPLFDGTGDDPEVEALATKLAAFAHTAPLREPPPRPPVRRRRVIGAAIGVAVAGAAVAFVVLGHRHGQPADVRCAGGSGFTFALSAGSATCDGAATRRGTLPVGAWLETKRDAVADVKVADIGDLTVYGDSRLRLIATDPTKHHLELARGHVAAKVTAPPRLFVVETPAATAVDLGCQYDLTVAGDGATHLRVTVGAVSLEGVYVPAGHEVDVLPGHRVGTPVPIDATPELRAAVAKLDAGKPGGLAAVVATANASDRVTLWNAVVRTRDPAAVDKLEKFAPLPDPALRAKILAGDVDALGVWLDEFVDRGAQAHTPWQ